MKPFILTKLLVAAFLLQGACGAVRAQPVPTEAKMGLGGMAAATAAFILGNQESTVYSTAGTDVLPPDSSGRSSSAGSSSGGSSSGRSSSDGSGLLSSGGALSPGGAAGIAGASGINGSAAGSGNQSFSAIAILANAPIGTFIVISTSSTSTTSSTGTSP